MSKASEFVKTDNVIIHLAYFDDKTTHTNKKKHVLSETVLKLRATSVTLEIELQMTMMTLTRLCL